MRKWFTYLLLPTTFISCTKIKEEKPVWLNENQKLIETHENLIFKTTEKNWKVHLYSFIQPIPTTVQYRNDSMIISLYQNKGIINGEAFLQLQKGAKNYSYRFYLKNQQTSKFILNDYRSPKTVNLDSSLSHQSIRFNVDSNRNLIKNTADNYFIEETISFSPKVKTDRAIKNEPLTTFYVQAGSANDIPIKTTKNTNLQQFNIVVGPIYDQHKNIIANGTQVAVEYTNEPYKGTAYALTYNGIAELNIPRLNNNVCTIKAIINNTFSKTLQLQ